MQTSQVWEQVTWNPVATIPADNIIANIVTSACPNIVLVGENEVTLTELTIPHNSLESLSDHRLEIASHNLKKNLSTESSWKQIVKV